ncbi:MAG: hypothetical protein A2143_10990 [Gallionellales bacterium RBG_16_57_15]|nr:MAG: hypothetical protein A2143_10990 [Gallionellales bacterium RBG_16_57_15]
MKGLLKIVAGLLCLAGVARAEAIAPDVLIDTTVRDVIAIVKQDKDIQAGDQKKILELVDAKVLPHFDFVRMTQLAVGKYWRRATNEDPQALQCWERYSFPGNTRELRNIVIRLATKYPGNTVNLAQLQDELDPLETSATSGQKTENRKQVFDRLLADNFSLDQYLHEQEDYYIAAALELASGNISEAARLLGINRTTLHSRLAAQVKLNT